MERSNNPRIHSNVGVAIRAIERNIAPQSLALLSEPSNLQVPSGLRMPNPASVLQSFQHIRPILQQGIQHIPGSRIVEQENQNFHAWYNQAIVGAVAGQRAPVKPSVISQTKKQTHPDVEAEDNDKKKDRAGRPLCSDSETSPSQSKTFPSSTGNEPNSSDRRESLHDKEIAKKVGEPKGLWKPCSRKVSLSSVSFGDTVPKVTKNSPDVLLPASFEPSEYCIICGRGKEFFNHIGNRRFRMTINLLRERYSHASTKAEKGEIVTEVMDMIHGAGGRFVRFTRGRWYEVNEAIAREKIGALFRDVLFEAYRSSTKAKVERRRQLKRDIKNKTAASYISHDGDRFLLPRQPEKATNQVPTQRDSNVGAERKVANPHAIRHASRSNDPPATLNHHLLSLNHVSRSLLSEPIQNDRASISISAGPVDFVEKAPEVFVSIDKVNCWLIGWSRQFHGR